MDVAYVALSVTDTALVAGAFERNLGLARADLACANLTLPAFQVGRTRCVVFDRESGLLGQDARTGVDHVAFATPDPEKAARDLGLVTGTPVAETFLDGGVRVAIPPEATHGLRVFLHTPLEVGAANTAVTERIDHLGVASTDNEASKAVFAQRFGLPVESFQTDIEAEIPLETFTSNKYGVVYHTRAPRVRAGIRGLFMTAGDFDLEFLETFDPGGMTDYRNLGPGHTRQDQGAVARFVASRGPGLHHIAFKVHDIDAVLADLGAAGHRLLDQAGRPGGRRSLIGFVHPAGMGGVLVHFVQRQEI